MNICRPLVPKYGLGCPGGTAACLATIDEHTGKPEQEQVNFFYLLVLLLKFRDEGIGK